MIYAKLHNYRDHAGAPQVTIISSLTKQDGMGAFDVPDASHLMIQGNKIIVKDQQVIVEEARVRKNEEIARKRALEYPPIADYLDAVVKGDKVQLQKYIDDCRLVKAKYPKV